MTDKETPMAAILFFKLRPKIFPVRTLYDLFGVLRHFQHCTGHIMTNSWKGRGNQYIQFVRVLYCKLPTNGKQLQWNLYYPTFYYPNFQLSDLKPTLPTPFNPVILALLLSDPSIIRTNCPSPKSVG